MTTTDTVTPTAAEEVCEHCGAEGPLAPTPHGMHCHPCYDLVMRPDEQESRSCDDTGIYADD
ncbi:hypothetical protein [Pseudomonas sp. PNPG3]|uniref:hypothetical protein n=1 Tax=Pseudomonas sp. PNPG3 TaxID=2919497 RepID=UPI001FFCFDDD|nr:hypothetical protein [Pseudomonas sp. PNPG3]MCK2122055.1 hypothetical protein [Pseudomonas sp. PNPG3]